jgi:hypothetical protein
MSKTNVIVMAKPSDPAEALRSERERIVANLETISRTLARLAEAKKDEERIFAEIAKLGEKEIEAVKAWVESGCEGPQPQPDAGERARLTKRMAAAVDAARAAKAVAGEVESEASGLRDRLAQFDAEIRARRISEFETQFAAAVAEFASLAARMRRLLLQIRSLPISLVTVGRQSFDRGDEIYGRVAFSAAEKMRLARLPEVEPEEAEVMRAVAAMTAKIVSGGEPRLVDNEFAADTTPAPNRDALLAAAIAANQASNQLNKPA